MNISAYSKNIDFFRFLLGASGLDKDLDQWVFNPLLFNLRSILLNNSLLKNIKLQKTL